MKGKDKSLTKVEGKHKRKRHPDVPVLSHSPDDAAARAGVGRSAIYNAIRFGSLQARKLGSRTLILDADLQAWISKLPVLTPNQPAA